MIFGQLRRPEKWGAKVKAINKTIAITAAAVILLALFGCGGSSDSSGGGGGAVTAAGGGTAEVKMKNTAFNPSDLTVDKGTTVKWTNDDSLTHTVVANDNSFSSGNMGKGQTFEFTFNQVGSFEYKCSIHPSMKGKITVK